ncbi:sensor histidine kinase [Microlunatus ginsengisoli]|uniref:Sensor histidine kinase n=1 Tax=Microlunatus ginsengisoli TaxID=363863 RepID=A0ABP6ZU94_9ACTN
MPRRPFLNGLFRPAPFEECDDPHAAPSAYRGPAAAPPWTWRRAKQNLVWVYFFGLIFLALSLPGIADGVSAATVVGRVVFLALIFVCYPLTTLMADTSLFTRWSYVVGFAALTVVSAVAWGWQFVNWGVYVAIVIAALVPWRQSRFAIVAWGALMVATWLVSRDVGALFIAVLSMGIGLAMGGGIEGGRITYQLERSRQRVSTLSVAAERERIGRDLHDILGHSLTAISIKSGLAARLVDADPAAARVQIAEVETIARQALADVRATASGLTEVRLATELASARSVLLAAGVEAQVPTAVPPLSDEVSELFGYVVREAVTNVVRHAEAGLCTISVGPTEVRIADDGTGRAGSRGSRGNGLRGLSERVTAAGGLLEVDSRPGAGTVIVARLSSAGRPAAEPVR